MEIGKIADCLTRMLDVTADTETAVMSTNYLRKQLDHVCAAYVQAVKVVWEIEKLQEATVGEVLGLDAAEIKELSGILKQPIVVNGGDA